MTKITFRPPRLNLAALLGSALHNFVGYDVYFITVFQYGDRESCILRSAGTPNNKHPYLVAPLNYNPSQRATATQIFA